MRHLNGLAIGLFCVCMLHASAVAAPVARVTPRVNLDATKGLIRHPSPGASIRAGEVAHALPISLPSNTRLQVLRDQGAEFKFWLDHLDIDWRAGAAAKKLDFRWTTQAQGAVSARWQVALYRYTQDLSNWQNPPGLVASGTISEVPKAAGSARFIVDFGSFAPAPGSMKPLLPKISAASLAASSTKLVLTRARSVPGLLTKDGKVQVKSNPKTPSTMRVVYFVRVIPVDASGKRVGLPSAPVEIGYGDLPPQPFVDMSYAVQSGGSTQPNGPEINQPTAAIALYAPIQKDTPGKIYHYVVTDNCPPSFGVLKPGDKMDMTPHKDDKSWLEKIGDFFSDAFSFVTGALNWVANAYADLKALAVSWAPGELQGVLSVGLDIGLAAIGLPPSIPNFDQLTNLGKGYMIAVAAEYAGVDPSVATFCVDQFSSAVSTQSNGGGNSAVWLKPDPDWYYRPAYMMIDVMNNTGSPTEQVTLNVMSEPVGDEDAESHAETVYYTTSALVPSLAPGQKLSIPIFFRECMPLRWDDTDLQAGLHRFWARYNSVPVRFVVSTFKSGPYKNRYVVHQTLELPQSYHGWQAPK